MPKKSKSSGWIALVGIAAVAAVYVWAIYLPTRRAIGQLNDEIRQKQDYCARTGDLSAVLGATQRQLDATLQYARQWEDTAPRGDQLSSLLGKINALSHAASARTTRFDPEPTIGRDRVSLVPVSMGLSGTFSQIFEFLAALEKLPQSIWITDVTIEKPRNTEKKGDTLACELSLGIFTDKGDSSGQEDHVD